MIRVGIIGAGTIGSQLASHCITTFKEDVRLVGVVDLDTSKEAALRKQLGIRRKYTSTQLVQKCDLIIEAAGAQSAFIIAKQALSSGKDVMIMSAGGLLKRQKEIYELAKNHRCCVYLPSGAVTGLDGIKSANIGRLKKVQLTTRKAPEGFKDAPYIKRKKINLRNVNEETLIFEGNAEQAMAGFPQNINISAALSLAGLGAKRTKVRIFVVPGLVHHTHEVSAEGEFGSIYTRTQNIPSAENPKTSHMAILSAVATLKRILGNVKVGT